MTSELTADEREALICMLELELYGYSRSRDPRLNICIALMGRGFMKPHARRWELTDKGRDTARGLKEKVDG